MIRQIAPLTLLVTLVACSAGLPPSIDADGVEDARQVGIRFSKLATTAPADLPSSGSAQFIGGIGSQITGDFDGRMVADMIMTVDFDRDVIDGDISNINITDREGEPTQRLGGTLDIDGVHNRGSLNARANGTLRIRDTRDQPGLTEMIIVLDGDMRTMDDDADAVAGDLAGGLAGDVTLRVFDGYFYGARR